MAPAQWWTWQDSTESGERLAKREFDVVRLQSSGASLVHGGAQPGDVRLGKVVGGQRPLVEELGNQSRQSQPRLQLFQVHFDLPTWTVDLR